MRLEEVISCESEGVSRLEFDRDKLPVVKNLLRPIREGAFIGDDLQVAIAGRVPAEFWQRTDLEYSSWEKCPDGKFVTELLGGVYSRNTEGDGYPNIPLPSRFVLALSEVVKYLGVKRVCDLGCGNAQTIILLYLLSVKKKLNVLGVDFDNVSLKQARQSLQILGLNNTSEVKIQNHDLLSEIEVPEQISILFIRPFLILDQRVLVMI